MNIPGLLWWLSGKESASNTGVIGDASLTLGLGRSPRGEHGNPLQIPLASKNHWFSSYSWMWADMFVTFMV